MRTVNLHAIKILFRFKLCMHQNVVCLLKKKHYFISRYFRESRENSITVFSFNETFFGRIFLMFLIRIVAICEKQIFYVEASDDEYIYS